MDTFRPLHHKQTKPIANILPFHISPITSNTNQNPHPGRQPRPQNSAGKRIVEHLPAQARILSARSIPNKATVFSRPKRRCQTVGTHERANPSAAGTSSRPINNVKTCCQCQCDCGSTPLGTVRPSCLSCPVCRVGNRTEFVTEVWVLRIAYSVQYCGSTVVYGHCHNDAAPDSGPSRVATILNHVVSCPYGPMVFTELSMEQ